MLILDEKKAKKLEFNMVEVKHILPDELKNSVILILENIKYGISGELDQDAGVISFEIPPISEFIKHEISEGQYDIMLEVIGVSKKFHDIPWTDKFTVTIKPGVAASLAESVDIEEEIPEIVATLSEDTDIVDTKVVDKPAENNDLLENLNESVKLPSWFTQK